MSDDRFDDGLVHSHHWATEKPHMHNQRRESEKKDQHDRYDDGLVHGHDWASWHHVRR